MGNALRAQSTEHCVTEGASAASRLVLGDFVIARLAPQGGATRADLVRDLTPFAAHRLSPSDIRFEIDASLETLEMSGNASGSRGRYQLTANGQQTALATLGGRTLPKDWAEARDVRLVAMALGLNGESAQRIKSLARPDGLRTAVLQNAYGLRGRRAASPARLRAALAGIALERAFGNKIKGEITSGEGLSARAGRQLAGQLAQRPRDFGTDSRLIATLAAEAVGAVQSDLTALRVAVLRQFVSSRLPPLGQRAIAEVAQQAVPAPPNGRTAPPEPRPEPGRRPPAATRPDLAGFAKTVLALADKYGEGWPGNRKALIVHVWQAVAEARPEWGLTEVEFKAMLTEAHRTGHVVLANADLKSKSNAKEIQDSAISFKNTVWHFVRIES